MDIKINWQKLIYIEKKAHLKKHEDYSILYVITPCTIIIYILIQNSLISSDERRDA